MSRFERVRPCPSSCALCLPRADRLRLSFFLQASTTTLTSLVVLSVWAASCTTVSSSSTTVSRPPLPLSTCRRFLPCSRDSVGEPRRYSRHDLADGQGRHHLPQLGRRARARRATQARSPGPSSSLVSGRSSWSSRQLTLVSSRPVSSSRRCGSSPSTSSATSGPRSSRGRFSTTPLPPTPTTRFARVSVLGLGGRGGAGRRRASACSRAACAQWSLLEAGLVALQDVSFFSWSFVVPSVWDGVKRKMGRGRMRRGSVLSRFKLSSREVGPRGRCAR